jgi:hypothetical protein
MDHRIGGSMGFVKASAVSKKKRAEGILPNALG